MNEKNKAAAPVMIGDVVRYVRHHVKHGIMEGKGRVKAYGLDPEGRIMVMLQDMVRKDETGRPEAFQTWPVCLNPLPETVKRFRDTVEQVKEIEKLAREEQQEIVDSANRHIGELHDALFGKPLDMRDEVAEDDPEPEEVPTIAQGQA